MSDDRRHHLQLQLHRKPDHGLDLSDAEAVREHLLTELTHEVAGTSAVRPLFFFLTEENLEALALGTCSPRTVLGVSRARPKKGGICEPARMPNLLKLGFKVREPPKDLPKSTGRHGSPTLGDKKKALTNIVETTVYKLIIRQSVSAPFFSDAPAYGSSASLTGS